MEQGGANPTPTALPASMGCASTMLELARHCIRLAPLVPFGKGEAKRAIAEQRLFFQ